MTKHKIVKLELRDASGLGESSREWFTIEEMVEKSKEMWDTTVTSIGYLIGETKDYYIMAATQSDNLFGDASMIPKKLVIKVTNLK